MESKLKWKKKIEHIYPISLSCSFKLTSLFDLIPEEVVELVSISCLVPPAVNTVEIVVVSDNQGFVRILQRCRGDGANWMHNKIC